MGSRFTGTSRRPARFITPIPMPRKRKDRGEQRDLILTHDDGLSTAQQQYDPTPIINELRAEVDAWRALPRRNDWLVTPQTARLLEHWRHYKFNGGRPFFCQIEAVGTAIWLTEVAPNRAKTRRCFQEDLAKANAAANPSGG